MYKSWKVKLCIDWPTSFSMVVKYTFSDLLLNNVLTLLSRVFPRRYPSLPDYTFSDKITSSIEKDYRFSLFPLAFQAKTYLSIESDDDKI